MTLFVCLLFGRGVGRWLVREDTLARADALYVLGGSVGERPVEAGDLFLAGWAPSSPSTAGGG
jgi:hypothetical protein